MAEAHTAITESQYTVVPSKEFGAGARLFCGRHCGGPVSDARPQLVQLIDGYPTRRQDRI